MPLEVPLHFPDSVAFPFFLLSLRLIIRSGCLKKPQLETDVKPDPYDLFLERVYRDMINSIEGEHLHVT